MYLNNLFIENMGSIERLQILEKDLFLEDGNPKPIILLGKNGSGKTTLISGIADSFLELGNQVFNHILPNEGIGHKYYKASGQINTRLGEEYSYTYLQYKNGEEIYEYIDKNGELKYDECKEKTNNLLNLKPGDWKNDNNYKNVSDISKDDDFFIDFQNNTYCYFPADRFEFPHWLIRDTDKHISKIIDEQKYYGDLRKQIIVKNSLDEIKSWLLDLFLDSKFSIKNNEDGTYSIDDNKSPLLLKKLNQWIINVEKMLTLILDKNVKLTVNLRGSGSRLNIFDIDVGKNFLPSLDNLSTGESILLCMFGTIIKNSDSIDLNKDIELDDIKGIVVIDEIDLHLHIRLQKEVLPKLIKSFPKVQFIISTHSPFFLYGMNKEFGDNILMLNMPSGTEITDYGNFDEFVEAYQVFDDLTQDYQKKYEKLIEEINNKNKHLIICEGKTDNIHIQKAIKKLGVNDLENIDFIESPSEGMGDDNLYRFLENISLIPRDNKIIGIFDRDNSKYVADKVKDLKAFGNNVFGFCIPIPNGREKYNKISIEFYYEDKDLKTEKNGECLHFTNEVLYDPRKKEGIVKEKYEDDLNKQIFDENIGNVEGVHSKARFAELVENDENFTRDFNFENFRLIIDKIKEILQIDSNQSN